MEAKYYKPGEVAEYYNGTGVAILAGAVVQVGFLCAGIAMENIAIAGTKPVAVQGVFTGAKASGAWTTGAPIYYDNSADNFTTVAGQLMFVGFASEPAASGDTVGKLKLARFTEEPPRKVTGAATGATAITAYCFFNGKPLLYSCANSAAKTVTLPDSTLVPGAPELQVIKPSGGANILTLAPGGSDTINGTTSYVSIDADNDETRFVLNGTDWRIITATIA